MDLIPQFMAIVHGCASLNQVGLFNDLDSAAVAADTVCRLVQLRRPSPRRRPARWPEPVAPHAVVLRPGTVLIRDPARLNAYVLRIGSTDQSYVDLDNPANLEFDYVQRIADLIDIAAPPGERIRVVHVGGAAMTIPRYVAATRPRSAQVVLEPDAALTEWIREWLPLPKQSGIKVRAVDGLTGIARWPTGTPIWSSSTRFSAPGCPRT